MIDREIKNLFKRLTYFHNLKWLQLCNSIDFELIIPPEILSRRRVGDAGLLYVRNLKDPFAKLKLTEEAFDCNGKIIECVCDDNIWKMIRVRKDKLTANTYRTAIAIAGSIRNPVTKEMLLNYLQTIDPASFDIKSLADYFEQERASMR